MPSAAALTIHLFGTTALVAGIYGLLDPASMAANLSLPTSSIPAVNGNSLASLAMGLYYNLAAYQENRTFFMMTIPMRLLTTTVFIRQGWAPAALWEGGGAVLTALALIVGGKTSSTSSHVKSE